MCSETKMVDDSDSKKLPLSKTIQINTDVNVRTSLPLTIVFLLAFVVTVVNIWIAGIALSYSSNLLSNDPNYSANNNNVSLSVKSENNTALKGTLASAMFEFLKKILYNFNEIRVLKMKNKTTGRYRDNSTAVPSRQKNNETTLNFYENFRNDPINSKTTVRLKRFTSMPFVVPFGKPRLEYNAYKSTESKIDIESTLNSIKNMLIDDIQYNKMGSRKEVIVNNNDFEMNGHFKPIPPYFHPNPNVSFLTTTPDSPPNLFIPPPPNKYLPITKPITLLPADSIAKTKIFDQPSEPLNEVFLPVNNTFSSNRVSGLTSFRNLPLFEVSASSDQFSKPSEEKANKDPVWIFVNHDKNYFHKPKTTDILKKSNEVVFSPVLPSQNKDPIISLDSFNRHYSQSEKHRPITFTTPILTNFTRDTILPFPLQKQKISGSADKNVKSINEDGAPSNVHYSLLPSPILQSLFVKDFPSNAFTEATPLRNELDIRTPVLHRDFQPMFINQIGKYKLIPDPVSIQKRLVMEVPSDVKKSSLALTLREDISSYENRFKNTKVNESLPFEEYLKNDDDSVKKPLGVSLVDNYREPRHSHKNYVNDVPNNKARSKFITFAYEILKQKRHINPDNDETSRHLVYKLVNNDVATLKAISPELGNKIDTFLKIYFDPNNINILQNIQRFISQ